MKITRLIFEKTEVIPNEKGTERNSWKSVDVVLPEDFHKWIEDSCCIPGVKIIGFEIIEE